MKTGFNHISVCICTYKRPELLANLLSKLQDQRTDGRFTYAAVVVDNDVNRTAHDTVETARRSSAIEIDYHVEPEQNIAMARNRAVENAKGSHVAFIDDDEYPVPEWLLNLHRTMHELKADAVLGPVRPHFPKEAPAWLIKSRLCERPEHKTGTVIHWGETRTGNVLLDRRMFEDGTNRFGREYGRTGGEDIEFFRKMAGKGKTFVWCNEAPTYETVPPERWGKKFYSDRYLRIGGLVGEKVRQREPVGRHVYSLIKSAAWIIGTVAAFPFSALFGEHIKVRVVTKAMYNIGVINGLLGRTIMRYRNE